MKTLVRLMFYISVLVYALSWRIVILSETSDVCDTREVSLNCSNHIAAQTRILYIGSNYARHFYQGASHSCNAMFRPLWTTNLTAVSENWSWLEFDMLFSLASFEIAVISQYPVAEILLLALHGTPGRPLTGFFFASLIKSLFCVGFATPVNLIYHARWFRIKNQSDLFQ